MLQSDGRWRWGTVAFALMTVLLAGCAPSASPETPITYRDDKNVAFALTLLDGGRATVEGFPAAPDGACVPLDDWPQSILREGNATWSLSEDRSIEVIGEGWSARLQYRWNRGSPDFAELRYPVCENSAGFKYFVVRSY